MKVFALFICCFYFLYIFIDYASHAKSFSHEKITLINILSYYLFQFGKQAEILIPLGLMIATIKVLTTANMRNEIVALASSGISLKKIMIPFFIAASFSSLFLYFDYQYLYPSFLNRLNAFEKTYFHEKNRSEKTYPVHQLLLEDQTILLYQSYDISEKAFFDVFWIKSANDFYRIKLLYPHQEIPSGRFVDHIERNPLGELIRKESIEKMPFPTMQFDQKTLFTAVTPPKEQSLNALFKTISSKKISLNSDDLNDREAQSITAFFYKTSIPLICFLAVLAPAPFCIRFGRRHMLFLIYALSLFGLIAFFTLIHSGVILGESKVVPPMIAVLATPIAFSAFFGWKFSRL